MDRKSKIKILSLSIAVFAVLSLLIVTSLNKDKKEAGILSANKEETNDNNAATAETSKIEDGAVKEEDKVIEITTETKK